MNGGDRDNMEPWYECERCGAWAYLPNGNICRCGLRLPRYMRLASTAQEPVAQPDEPDEVEPEQEETEPEKTAPAPARAEKRKRRRKWRKQLKPETRQAVLERDGFCCAHCGDTEQLHIHHRLPRSKGGSDELPNLVTLCAQCHVNEHWGEPVALLMLKQLGA